MYSCHKIILGKRVWLKACKKIYNYENGLLYLPDYASNVVQSIFQDVIKIHDDILRSKAQIHPSL